MGDIGMKQLPSYHDWYLASIESNYTDEVTLKVFFQDNARIVKFSGVVRCLFDNFREGNILSEMKVVDPDIPEERLIKETSLLPLKYIYNNKDELKKPHFKETVEKIRKGELLLVEISASYGCEGAILCKGFEERVWERPITDWTGPE